MKYFSLHKKAPIVSFQEAVVKGLAPDKGLYYPEKIQKLPEEFFETMETLDNVTIAYEAIKQFIGDEIPSAALKDILKDVLSFNFPLVSITDQISVLELYHGPTLAFKDVGARFMARCLEYFNRNANTDNITVLVATSGDTGGAVAAGFYKVTGVDVVILYPSGKVSEIQEKQLTTLGENIVAVEVEGTFDDCQAMVKQAFLDRDIIEQRTLTSANSINIARWLPQMFYYFLAYKELKSLDKELVFSVPSGNFGNICAGMMAQKLGLPIQHFVTGTNANNIVPAYLQTGEYITKASIATISNAMDVGAPSNFVRIQQIYNHNFSALCNNLSGYSYTDDETRAAMHYLYDEKHYIADPHGAIGYLALQDYLKGKPNVQGIFLETAHPVKFLDVIPKEISNHITIPDTISSLLYKEKSAIKISSYNALKTYLLS